MILFQALIKVLKKFGINANKLDIKANDILDLIAGNEINLSARNISWTSNYLTIGKDGKITINSKADNYTNAEFSILGNTYANYLYSSAILIKEKNSTTHQAYMELLSNDASMGLICNNGYITMNASSGIDTDGTITSSNIASDRNLKNHINDAKTNALDVIKQIKHREFDWKKDNKHINIGYIAQELEEIEPNFVIKNNGRYYVDFLPILATATKAIQEISKRVEKLEGEK